MVHLPARPAPARGVQLSTAGSDNRHGGTVGSHGGEPAVAVSFDRHRDHSVGRGRPIVLMTTALLVLYGVKYLPAFLFRWRLVRAVQNLSQDLHTIAVAPQSAFRALSLSLSLLLHGMTSLAVMSLG